MSPAWAATIISGIVLMFCTLIWRQHEPGSDTRRVMMPMAALAVLTLFLGVMSLLQS